MTELQPANDADPGLVLRWFARESTRVQRAAKCPACGAAKRRKCVPVPDAPERRIEQSSWRFHHWARYYAAELRKPQGSKERARLTATLVGAPTERRPRPTPPPPAPEVYDGLTETLQQRVSASLAGMTTETPAEAVQAALHAAELRLPLETVERWLANLVQDNSPANEPQKNFK